MEVVVLLLILFLYFYVFIIHENTQERLVKDITKQINYKLKRKKYYKGNRLYSKQYDKLIVMLQFVGYSYKDVTIYYNYKEIAKWTICNDNFTMSFTCYDPLFTYKTLEPFFRED